jgi:hypothetical protein
MVVIVLAALGVPLWMLVGALAAGIWNDWDCVFSPAT